MSTASAPMEIGRVALVVNDIGLVGSFYKQALGLAELSNDGETMRLGAGSTTLLELRADKAARRRNPQEAGLFHTAFLLPSRADLGAWLLHASDSRLPLEGASDHLVSEAIYLSDPEGNGIEVYIDRPRSGWKTRNGQIQMATNGLDLNDLAAAAKAPFTQAPEGTVIGHVHLQTGSVPEAEAFYSGDLGFAISTHYPGAAFYGSGGYHHHLATNTWNSRGASLRKFPSTGLADLQILVDAEPLAALRAKLPAALSDPWGTPITLSPKAA
ncbi:ring-cleaving dioxygenase [Cypionkella aquatica]|uniref:Ring-cleaving dioxygenase n=1 Tax=Cypionkella aquatica TaxID=1756042 RepID=A0AA37TSY0_9RHOB|nr:VOC family protein [Cypionkella aquatica]GLS86962.1 ring-cleaving dioxygenase [Cypionkella aquatica]